MDEGTWRATDDVVRLLGFAAKRVSRRKVDLFRLACAEAVVDGLSPEDSVRELVERVGRNVDPVAGPSAAPHLRSRADEAMTQSRQRLLGSLAETRGKVRQAVVEATHAAVAALILKEIAGYRDRWDVRGYGNSQTNALYRSLVQGGWERAYQGNVTLLRCIVGDPFRPVTFAPEWRTSTAVALAQAIYTERAFDRLPVLADALEEAGCDHPDVLAHCRGDGPHARGCWVVDGVLGKA